MRVYRLSNLWLLAALGLGAWGWQDRSWMRWLPAGWYTGVADWRLSKLAEATVSMVFVLDRERWTEFDLRPAQETIRLVTNATLPLSAVPEALPPPSNAPPLPWQYGVHYQVLDPVGAVLVDRQYSLHTRLTVYRDPATGQTFTGSFYLAEPQVSADGRIVVVKLTGLPGRAARIRVRLIAKESPLVDVVTRVYQRQASSVFRLRYRWQRMTEEKRRVLARANLYPADLLSEQEKINLLQNQWSPVAPSGVEGENYRRRELYVLREAEGDEGQRKILPAGTPLFHGRHALIPIPDPGGRIRLAFLSPEEQAVPAAPNSAVTVSWYGRGRLQRATRTVPWTVGGSATVLYPGGLLEVAVPGDTVLRAFLSPADAPPPAPAPAGQAPDQGLGVYRSGPAPVGPLPGETEITAEPIFLRTYLTEVGKPVEYDVLHEGQAPVSFRVDLRRKLAADGTGAASIPVSYEWLDAEGRSLKRGEMAADGPPSTYDDFQTDPDVARVSDRVRFFFTLTAAVARVRFVSAGPPVLVSAYDRPAALTKRTRVPEDYKPTGPRPDRLPGWFLFRASDYDRLSEERRTPLLVVQTRPSEENADLEEGRYLWEEFRPQGPWLARPLFVPQDPTTVGRPEALPSTFRELTPGAETALSFKAPDDRGEVSPTLLFLSDASGPVSLSVTVDGIPHQTTQVSGARGEILLPPVQVGARRVQATASRPVQLYMNFVDTGGGDPHTLRLANRVDPSGMEFLYDKRTPGEELLSARLFLLQGRTERIRAQVVVEPPPATTPGPHIGWTYLGRLFDILPAGGAPVPVMGTVSESVDAGQPFYILLNQDLPPGPCRIRMRFDPAPTAYLVLTRITPGEHETRGFFVETESE